MAVTGALTAHEALPVQEHPIFTGGLGVWRILCIVQMRQGGAEQTAGAKLTGIWVGTGPTRWTMNEGGLSAGPSGSRTHTLRGWARAWSWSWSSMDVRLSSRSLG